MSNQEKATAVETVAYEVDANECERSLGRETNRAETVVEQQPTAEIISFPNKPTKYMGEHAKLATLIFNRFVGRRSAYGKRALIKREAKWGYLPAREHQGAPDDPLTEAVIHRHLEGTEPIGVYLFEPGGDTVRFAAIDIDNGHGDNEALSWSELVERIKPLYDHLCGIGDVLAVRSGGGSGVHLILFFSKPEKAEKVRGFLTKELRKFNLREDRNVSGGIKAGIVEIFPKQDRIDKNSYGNLIALPFARLSVPLDDALEPLPIRAASKQLATVADYEFPDSVEDLTPDVSRIPDNMTHNVVRFDVAAALVGVGEGGRDIAAFSLAGKLRAADLPFDEAADVMARFCNRCQPPLPEAVGLEKLRRAYVSYSPNIECTDSGNAAYFARLYGDVIRYDHARKRWLVWAGHWWQPDRSSEIVRLAKQAVSNLGKDAMDLSDPKRAKAVAAHAIKSRSANGIKNLLSLSQSEPPISDTGEGWNPDPWLFGVANGVVDLRTGELRSGRQDDRITMHSLVAYDPTAQCPQWKHFLSEIYSDDPDLIEFVQRYAGYSLTGMVDEEMLTMHYGGGSNGKSVLLKILCAVFGEYAHTLPFTELEDWARQRVSSEIASLVGKRLIVVSEANERARLNEARVKSLTSRDRMRARFLYCESFEFEQTQHYWIAFNDRPEVSDDSNGFWRRVALVPYEQTFAVPKANGELPEGTKAADLGLEKKLLEELPGILAWVVRGCLRWQSKGMRPFPVVVEEATDDYKESEDQLGTWMAERCVTGDKLSAKPSALHADYMTWAEGMGMPRRSIMSHRVFGEKMGKRFESAVRKGQKVYLDIALRYQPGEHGPDVSLSGVF